MVLMAALLQLLELLESFKWIKAYWASILIGVPLFQPLFFFNLTNLKLCKSFIDFSISLFKLKELLICHGICIRIVRVLKCFILAFFNGFLKKPLFFGLNSIITCHALHYNLHHHLLLPLFLFLLLNFHSNSEVIFDCNCFIIKHWFLFLLLLHFVL